MIFISRWQHHSATAIREMVFLHCRFNNRQTQKRTGLELTIEKTVRCAELQPNRMSRRTVKKLLLCIQLPLLPFISLDWQPSRRKSCVLATYVVLSKIYYHNYRMRKVNSFWICHHIIHVVCGKDKILNASCVTCTIIFSRHWNTNGVQIELSSSYTGVHSNVKCMAFFLSFNSPIEIPQRKIKIQQRRLFFIFQRYVPIWDTFYHNWDE